MPSFDVVSELDWHEVTNGMDQANREIANRFDFKGSDARIERSDAILTLYAEDEFKIGQVRDILDTKLVKRGIDIACMEVGEVRERGAGQAQLEIKLRHGLDTTLSKSLVKKIKAEKLKVQTAIQGDQLRISGKKRDELQSVIAFLKNEEVGLPLQYINFRD